MSRFFTAVPVLIGMALPIMAFGADQAAGAAAGAAAVANGAVANGRMTAPPQPRNVTPPANLSEEPAMKPMAVFGQVDMPHPSRPMLRFNPKDDPKPPK